MGQTKIGVTAVANAEKFESTIEKLAKFRDKVLGIGKAVTRAYTGSQTPINYTAKDKFTQANQDRLAKLEQTRKVFSTATGAARTLVTSFAALGAVFGADKMVTGLLDIGQALFDVDKQARHAGDSTQKLMAFQYGARRIGEDVSEASAALYDLYGNFLHAAAGGKIAQRAFEGILDPLRSGEMLKGTPAGIFDEVADQIAKLEKVEDRIAAVRRLTNSHSSAQAMIGMVEASRTPSSDPYLGKGMKALGGHAIDQGFAVRSEDVASLRETARKFEDAANIIKGAWVQMVIGMAPLAKMAADWATKKGLTDPNKMATEIGPAILTAFEWVHNWLIDVMVFFSNTADYLGSHVIHAFATAVKTFIDGVNSFNPAGKIDTGGLQGMIERADKASLGRINLEAEWHKKKYKDVKGRTDWDSLLNINKALFALGEQFGAPAYSKTAANAQKRMAQNQPLFDAAQALRPSLLTPYELYTDEISKFDAMLNAKALMMPEYGRAVNKALLSFEEALHLTNVSLPTIAKMNTAQAESTVAKSKLEYELKMVDTPQKRMERAQAVGNQILGRIEENSKTVAEAAKKQGTRRPFIINGAK